MKDQAIQYLALDVHQSTVVACARDERGSITIEATVPTEAKAILRLVRGVGPRVHVVFEEGTQAQWLHDLLKPAAEKVMVANVRGVRSELANKSDRIDGRELSERLRLGSLKTVYHGASDLLTLKELVRNYDNLVGDATRVMGRIKALFRARAVQTPGVSVYRASQREDWLNQLPPGARIRANSLLEQLDLLLKLRPEAKAAMVKEAKKRLGWKSLRSLPYMGDIRVSYLMAIMATPHRFRTKRNLWPYAGLAVVTRSSADTEYQGGQLRRRRRPPRTRGLNRNHNPMLKAIFKGVATAAASRPGPLKDCYDAMVARGTKPELAMVTLARKIASITLTLWKKGELWDPKKLTMQST